MGSFLPQQTPKNEVKLMSNFTGSETEKNTDEGGFGPVRSFIVKLLNKELPVRVLYLMT